MEGYTLCAINSQTGKVPICFSRWAEVLKPGGLLFIEEEFPLYSQDSQKYFLWRMYWRFIKSLLLYAGKNPYQEIDPQTLDSLLKNYHFVIDNQDIGDTLTAQSEIISALFSHFSEWKNFLPNGLVRLAFWLLKNSLLQQIKVLGTMITPYYSIRAHLKEK